MFTFIFDFLQFISFSWTFWDFFCIFWIIFDFFKLLSLLLKVTKVNNKHQKSIKLATQNNKLIFAQRVQKASYKDQSPPQELEESPHSVLYLLLCSPIFSPYFPVQLGEEFKSKHFQQIKLFVSLIKLLCFLYNIHE